ncbi:hypothetical protein [Paenibacillus radicis (ex Xue et al. 2023)]|uniref:Uncharacterized protein n=1 Tax=Paenibacillus radicis (ex Xue et al. 2023) TaxID=2972489 RepID=A0ABT1YN25_9BACL|nr:hypothetical protein [Paenibacillus radicis (ex Xue et al. 2023)]MCR8634579.1 hypothetical protein [Paenibacillus radicis (ex Xue et al. 2023)]
MTKEHAIDRSKMLSRENQKSYFVVHSSETNNDVFNNKGYQVVDQEELDKQLALGAISKDKIIFSIEV